MSCVLFRSLFALAGVLVVACSGGTHVPVPAPANVASSAPPTATARLTLTIPRAGILARKRSTLYISPSTAQAVVVVNSASPQSFSLSPTGPNCQTTSGVTACVLNVAAPIGPSDAFQVALEDSSADILSAGAFTAAISEGATNVTFPLVLGGVPKTLDIISTGALGTFFTLGGGSQTSTLTTTVKDAAGDILIGNEPFTNAAGAPTPISISSANGSQIAYATEPLGGSFGAASTTFSLSAASDVLEMVFSGSGVPPGYDTLTYASGVTSATFGNNTPFIGIGAVWHSPFVAVQIAPITADVAVAGGTPHSAIVTDGVSDLEVVGGGAQCSVPPLAAAISNITSIAIDGGAAPADTAIYTVSDTGFPATNFVEYSLSAVNAGTCTQLNPHYNYSGFAAVGGIVRATAGALLYFASDPTGLGGFPELDYATSTAPTTIAGGNTPDAYPVGGLALRGTHVFTCGNNLSNILITQYEQPISILPVISSGPVAADTGTGQTGSCAGIAVDGSDGRAVFADIGSNVATRSATFPISAQDPINLTGTTVVGSQSIDFQSAATGNWHQAEAFFINASDGIEVFNQNPTIVQQAIVNLGNSGLSSAITSGSVEAIAYGDDQRLWMSLSSGYVIALPTY